MKKHKGLHWVVVDSGKEAFGQQVKSFLLDHFPDFEVGICLFINGDHIKGVGETRAYSSS